MKIEILIEEAEGLSVFKVFKVYLVNEDNDTYKKFQFTSFTHAMHCIETLMHEELLYHEPDSYISVVQGR